MPTTSEIRSWWAPACRAHEQSLQEAYEALDAWLERYKYAPEAGHTGAFNCRPITGGTAYSLHAFDPDGRFKFWSGVEVTKALAVDINWRRNPYGKVLVTDMPPAMVQAIKGVRTNNGRQVWRWGGDYSGNKDAMHYEIVCRPEDLATGIRASTLPGGAPAPQPDPGHEEDEVRLIYATLKDDPTGKVYLASVKSEPRHVKLFLDAEYHAALTGDVIVPPPADPNTWREVEDANGQRRKVLALGDGTLYGIG